MSDRAKIVVFVVLLAAIGFGALVFHFLYVPVEETVKTPPRGRAAVDPYYALELFLTEQGLEVIPSSGSLHEIERADATFWLADESPTAEPKTQGYDLWSAYESGALVVLTDSHLNDLVARWGPYALQAGEDLTEEAYTEPPHTDAEPARAESAPRALRFHAHPDVAGEAATMPSLYDLSNKRIGRPEHARAIADIAARIPEGSTVLLVRRLDKTSLLDLLFGPGLPAILAFLFALALLAARSAPRFGPVLEEPAPGRRSFLEHLGASGQLVRRMGGQAALLRSARAEVLERFIRRSPELEGLRPEAQVERLKEQSSLDRETLTLALVTLPGDNPRLFTEIVSALQKLRKTP